MLPVLLQQNPLRGHYPHKHTWAVSSNLLNPCVSMTTPSTLRLAPISLGLAPRRSISHWDLVSINCTSPSPSIGTSLRVASAYSTSSFNPKLLWSKSPIFSRPLLELANERGRLLSFWAFRREPLSRMEVVAQLFFYVRWSSGRIPIQTHASQMLMPQRQGRQFRAS